MWVDTWGQYTISFYDKIDGNPKESDHPAQQFFSVSQVHGSEIYFLDKEYSGYDRTICADAICTSQKYRAGIYVADCNPVLLGGMNYYCIAHLSRKTIMNGLLEKSVNLLCRHGECIIDMYVYIGPSAKQLQYEVGPEFINFFPVKYLLPKGDRYLFDMQNLLIDRLLLLGVQEKNIFVHPDCTIANEHYWSYRCGDKGLNNFMGITSGVLQ